MLQISNLNVEVGGKRIVSGVTMTIKQGEIHVLMGPNGSGKTSLAMAVIGHPAYKVKSEKLKVKSCRQQIILDGVDIGGFSPDKRAKAGLFLAFQNPLGIDGVSIRQLLQAAIPKFEIRNPKFETIEHNFQNSKIEKIAKQLGIKEELLKRSLNMGFSGGEKKKMEMLQMMILQPKYAILDEVDGGLDVDVLKQVMQMVKMAKCPPAGEAGLNGYKPGIVLITHNPRIFRYLEPDAVHIMKEGKIIKSGGKELTKIIEKEGYEGIK